MNTTPSTRPRRRYRYPRHPLFDLLRAEGRSQAWLARATGYSRSHVKALASGYSPPGPVFRARAAAVLGRPESELFHVADTSSAPPPAPPEGARDGESDRAGAAVLGAVYSAPESPSRRSA